MRKRSGVYRLAGQLGLMVAGIVVACGVMEIGLRLVIGHYLNPFEPDPMVAYRLKPNFAGRYPWIPVRTDAQGFRVPAVHAAPSRRTILFVGDSVTFGFGVLAEEAYPVLFGERIGRPGDILNAAVPGYNLEQVVRTIRRVVGNGGRPELIVYGLCLNDIGSAKEMSLYEDIDPHAERKGGGLLGSSLLASVVERRVQRLTARSAPAGPADSKESLLHDLTSPAARVELASFDREWSELEELQRSTQIPIVVVVLPYRQQVIQHPDWQAPQEYLHAKCSSSPLRCLDPWMMFRAHRDEDLYTVSSSMHFSPHGGSLLADWLADSLRDLVAQSNARHTPS